MSKTPTSLPIAKPGASPDDGGVDWAAFDAMTDDEVMAAALADPDAQPLTDAQLATARRVGLHGVIRFRLKLSVAEFAARYRVPEDVVMGWERGTITPDAVAKAYVQLINADPEGVAAALARAQAVAAE